MEKVDWARVRDILISTICIGILLWAGWSLMGQFIHVIVLLLLAMAVAFLLTPLVNLLDGYKYMPRVIAALIVYVVVLAILGALGYALVFSVINQAQKFSDTVTTYVTIDLPNLVVTLQKFLIDQNVPSSNITTAVNQLQQYATDFAQSLASNVVYIVLAVGDALVNILLVVVLSFYLTLDGKRVRDSIFSIAPRRSIPHLRVFEDALNRVVGNYIRGLNFDNMRYSQVYNRGPFEEREPLYHSDPFFMEFNGVPDQESVYGIFVDNYSQVCADVGCFNSSRYMFGTRFGDLNYYFLLGQTCADVLDAFTALVGKPRLKPRYVLGYHQGCYGYEKRQDLEDVVKKYREYGIPLDGLHIDVDIQQNYRTFTIDESKFPNPQEMFARLREQGVKCSTNITPIISNKDPNYKTYQEGLAKGYFVLDKRSDPDNPDGRLYQNYKDGSEDYYPFTDPEQNFDKSKPYIGEVYYGDNRGTTGHYPDLGRREVRDWWGTQYQYLFDMGLEMVWQDMTTPAIRDTRGDMRGFPFRLVVTDDALSNVPPKQTPAIKVWNLYSYDLHKATYHGLNHLAGRENKRNFIIGRGCFSGVNRFAGLWTGDNASTWPFLKMNVSQVLALGLCGVPICGQDIGGFELEKEWQHWADPELLIRWTCVGAFLPWFRNHYIAKGKKYFQEPYAYQSVNLDAWNIPQEKRYLYRCVLPICKYYIELRYRLLQLFYDAMFENILDGMPICRAMFLNDPSDQALYNDKLSFLDNQFFIRKDLLIAPILDSQSDSNANGKCDVYLPAGSDWYAFMDNKWPLMPAVEGGTTVHDYNACIDDSPGHIGFIVPIYVRAGAIIPTIELEQYVGQLNALNQPNPITLNIYPVNIPPGQDGQPTSKPYEYIMYLDDGVSRSSAPLDAPQYLNSEEEKEQANSEYRETHITHAYLDRKTREIKVERTHDKYTPKFETYFFVAVLHDPAEPKGSAGPLKSISIQRDGDRQKVDPMTLGTPEQRVDNLKASITDAWYYNEDVNVSFIKVIDNNKLITITAEYIS